MGIKGLLILLMPDTINISELSDEDLIREFVLKSDERYIGEIYNRYAIKIMQKCLSFARNESMARDMTHEIFLKIMLKSGQFKEKSKLSTWIYSITYNHCVDTVSRRSRQFKVEIEESQLPDIPEEEATDVDVLDISREELEVMLSKLSAVERSMLLMKYQDGLSIKEISKITNCGISAVKMKLKRSKAKLKNIYYYGS